MENHPMKKYLAYWWHNICRGYRNSWNSLGIFGSLIGAIIGLCASLYFSDSLSENQKSVGIFVGMSVGLIAAFLLLGIIQAIFWIPYQEYNNLENAKLNLHSKLNDIENSKPVISVKNPNVGDKSFGNVVKKAISIEVFNISPNTKAEAVYPTVQWYSKGKKVAQNQGRWWFSTQDRAAMRTEETQTVDLVSNRMPHLFHFAIQEPGDKFFSTWYCDRDGKHYSDPLRDAKYIVKIHFGSNSGVDADYTYIVTNNNGNLSIKDVNNTH
jgi:hypothetical protein